MTTLPAEHCGPACTEAHTYRLGECALSCAPVDGGIADPSWSVPCRPPGCTARPGQPCRRRDGSPAGVSHDTRWREYDRQQERRLAAEQQPPADNEPRCAECGSLAVVYRNYLEQPFCGPCANGERQTPPAPDPAPLECVCGAPVDWLIHPSQSGWIHEPGSDAPCAHVRPRCPECQMPHALAPDMPPMCRSIRRHLDDDRPTATEAAGAPKICEIPHPTAEEEDACERRRLADAVELPTHGAPVALAEPAAPGTLRERLFATVRFLLGDGPWDVIAWHIADACLAEALRPERLPRRRPDLTPEQRAGIRAVLDEQQPTAGGGFRFTDPDGDRLHITPTHRRGQPTVTLRTVRGRGRGQDAVDVPADQVEDVIAGLRDVRRQASSEPAPPARPRATGDEQTGGVRVEYRASVPRHMVGVALAEAFTAIAEETAADDEPPALG